MVRAAFGALTVALWAATWIGAAPAASAALGSVVVNGSVHRDPGGCMEVGGHPAGLAVENHTDVVVTVYSWPGCRGEVLAVLTPTQSLTITGSSLLIS
ncbi:hypothetical protein [Nocardia bovistercoris]|uniref:Secreted protein n=1 Tax=Nocardia bovistercoris TaxID=2785916 RepID=A0A931N2Z9_9NOCA|nr:hypothetical protein [Nocardia bovistercoris]MBH0780065.1 hypothetical protein [Nocardia bovistercoris]